MNLVVSGGHFRATRHRVHQPPPSQENVERLSLVLFNGSKGDLRMEPAWGETPAPRHLPSISKLTHPTDSPLIKRDGCFESQGAYKEFKALRDRGEAVSLPRLFAPLKSF